MMTLARKELRSMRPFLTLAVFIPVVGILYELLTGLPHMRPVASTVGEYAASGWESSILVFVVFFSLASGLLVREYDEGTIEFLDALPVSRVRIFFTKFLLALSVPFVLIVLDISTVVLLQAMSHNSLHDTFHWGFLATALMLRMCQALTVLCLGLALSFFRRFGWLVVGLLFWAYLLLQESLPAIRVLNLFAITAPKYDGLAWIVPWRQVWLQLALSSGLLTVACALFLGAGDRLLRSYHRLTNSLPGRAALWIGGASLFVVAAALGYQMIERYEEEEEGVEVPGTDIRIVYPSWSTSRATTQHYEFLYPNNLEGRSRQVITGADEVHERVREFLDAEPFTRIVVDMTGVSAQHAGRAHWEKVRIDLTTSGDADVLRAVLGHETAHVYLDRMSDSRLLDVFDSTRFFHEGVASYVEYRLLRPAEDIQALWSVAAVMRARKQVDFDELVNNERLSARLDTDLVYPLGEVFVEAMVEVYGPESVGRTTHAMARDDAPRGLSGQELWRDVFQACDYNLETVIDRFFAKLDEQVAEHHDFIQALPRVRGIVNIEHGLITVRADWQTLEGWQPVCRFRQAEDTPARQYIWGDDWDGEFLCHESSFPDGVCWYQLGLSDGKGRVIYEPWNKVPVPTWE